MIYVTLGIIVLIASFIIALISLVYEQKKLEKKQDEVDEQSGLFEADTRQGIADSEQAKPTSDVGLYPRHHTKTVLNTQQIDTGEQLANFSDDGAWWKQLEHDSFRKDELPKTDEDKSIESIRLELAKMVSGRGGLAAVDETQGGDEPENGNEQKKGQLLSGEFSLGDIKGRD